MMATNNAPFYKVMATAILIATILAYLVLTAGCYTEKKANRQVVKAYAEYPDLVNHYCGQWNDPIVMTRDSFIYKPGRILHIPGKTQYVEVDCDSVVRNAKKTAKVQIPCTTDTIRITDTVYRSRESTEVNRAKERALEAEVRELTIDKAKLQKAFSIAMWCVVLLGIYTLGRWVLRIWKIKLP